MAHRNLLASKNLDVPETSHDPVTQAAQGSAGDLTLEPLLSVVCPFPAQPNRQREHRGCYRPLGSKYISVPPATNHVEAHCREMSETESLYDDEVSGFL